MRPLYSASRLYQPLRVLTELRGLMCEFSGRHSLVTGENRHFVGIPRDERWRNLLVESVTLRGFQ